MVGDGEPEQLVSGLVEFCLDLDRDEEANDLGPFGIGESGVEAGPDLGQEITGLCGQNGALGGS